MKKFKKTVLIFLVIFITFSVLSIAQFTASAAEYKYGGYKYVIINSSIKITRYEGSATVLNIPSSINGYPVKAIGNGAFNACVNVTDVTIPDTVTELGDSAFYECFGLKSVKLSKNINRISSFAFCRCPVLNNVKIPDSVKSIDNSAFYGCSTMSNISISNSLKSIGQYAFYDCFKLKSVTLPNTVDNIGYLALGFYEDYYDHNNCKISGFTIKGYKNSKAETYAKQNGFNFSTLITNPTYVTLNKSTLTLGAGEKYGLIKTVSPSNANQSCKWSSSNSTVASVDSNGKVTAKKAGTSNITVKTANGKSAACKVTVKPAPTSLKINPTSLTLGKGETYTISESTNGGTYANAANLKWSSSNSSVATVTKGSGNKAKITAKGVGTAYIKITLFNGKTAQCKVEVISGTRQYFTVSVGNYTIADYSIIIPNSCGYRLNSDVFVYDNYTNQYNNQAGNVLYICVTTDPNIYPNYRIMGKKNGYYFCSVNPTDVQWLPELGQTCKKTYESSFNAMQKAISSFRFE